MSSAGLWILTSCLPWMPRQSRVASHHSASCPRSLHWAKSAIGCIRDLCSGAVIWVRQAMYLFSGVFATMAGPTVSLMFLHNIASLWGHTCESGSIAASEGLLPSVLLRLWVSFDCAEGEAGLRSFAPSFLLVNGPTAWD